MTEIMKFTIPLRNLGMEIESRPASNLPAITTEDERDRRIYTATLTIGEEDTIPSNIFTILDHKAWTRLIEEMAALHPQTGKPYSGSVLERAKRRRIEIVIREAEG